MAKEIKKGGIRDRLLDLWDDLVYFFQVRPWAAWLLFGTLFLAGAGCGVFLLVSSHMRSVAVRNADAQMAQAAELREAAKGSQTVDPVAVSEEESEESLPDGVTLGDYKKLRLGNEEHASDEFLTNRIGFSAIRNMLGDHADDVWGWVMVPDTEIDYIVMKDTEEEPLKYLWKDIYGEDSKTGSLFVQSEMDDVSDHTVIYGHRLKDHDLYFGPLLSFRDMTHANRHTSAYTYEEDAEGNGRVTRWALTYVCEGEGEDAVYYHPYARGTDEWGYLVDEIESKAVWVGEEFLSGDHMLVLSTCSGPRAGAKERLYLVYRDAAIWQYTVAGNGADVGEGSQEAGEGASEERTEDGSPEE